MPIIKSTLQINTNWSSLLKVDNPVVLAKITSITSKEVEFPKKDNRGTESNYIFKGLKGKVLEIKFESYPKIVGEEAIEQIFTIRPIHTERGDKAKREHSLNSMESLITNIFRACNPKGRRSKSEIIEDARAFYNKAGEIANANEELKNIQSEQFIDNTINLLFWGHYFDAIALLCNKGRVVLPVTEPKTFIPIYKLNNPTTKYITSDEFVPLFVKCIRQGDTGMVNIPLDNFNRDTYIEAAYFDKEGNLIKPTSLQLSDYEKTQYNLVKKSSVSKVATTSPEELPTDEELEDLPPMSVGEDEMPF